MTVIVPAKHVLETYTNDDELQDFIVKEVKSLSVQLAPYKRPVNIIVRKEPLPRTSTNKVKRNIVKEETMA
jgi:acyl-coenzyme A synthetase/AMP-(fatty) acid ligase